MLKIEVGGNVGKVCWRLIVVLLLLGLFLFDFDLDLFSNIGLFIFGFEVEILFGDSL